MFVKNRLLLLGLSGIFLVITGCGRMDLSLPSLPPAELLPTFALKDSLTSSFSYSSSTTVDVFIADIPGTAKWCISETQTTKPGVTCAGGNGPINGWHFTKPVNINLVNTEGEHKVYLWVESFSGKINSNPVFAKILLDLSSPAITYSVSSSSPVNDGRIMIGGTCSDLSGIPVGGIKICAKSSGTCSYPGDYLTFANCVSGFFSYSPDLPEGLYDFEVKAVDNLGHISSAVGEGSQSYVIDKTNPATVIFLNPNGNITWGATSYAFSWSASDNGGSGLKTSNTFRIESFANGTCSGTAAALSFSTTGTFNFTGLANSGIYSVKVTAYDNAGNVSAAACSGSVTINLTAPTFSLADQTSSSTSYTNAALVDVSIGNDAGIAKWCLSQSQSTQPANGSAPCVGGAGLAGDNNWLLARPTSFTLAGGDSSKTIYLWIADAGDNIPFGVTASIILDTTIPVSAIDAQPNDPTNSTTAVFNFSATDAGSGVANFQCQIDGGGYSSCVSPKTYTALSAGAHTFHVRATDNAENTSASQSYVWTIDSTSPVLTITSTTPIITNGNAVSFNGNCEAGLTVYVTGTDTTSTTCAAGTWTYTSTAQTTDGSRVYTFTQTDTATNATSVNGTWTRDTTPPVLTSGEMKLNNAASSTINNTLQINLQGADGVSNISHFCLRWNNTTAPLAGDACWVAVDAPIPGLPLAQSLTLVNYPFLVGFAPGNYIVYAWLKDASGNISTLSNSGAGTSAKDKDDIFYDRGAPPTVTSLSVVNGTAGANFGTTTFTAGDIVNISWTVTDAEGLSNTPIIIYYSTDNTNYPNLVAIGGTAGSTSGNPTSWSSSYSGFAAPTSGFFRLKFSALDAAGNSATVYSGALNTGKWSIFAGTATSGNGGLATAAEIGLGDLNGATQTVLQTANGDIYVSAGGLGIRKISAATGIIDQYISTTPSEQNIPGTIGVAPLPGFRDQTDNSFGTNMIKDNQDNLYVGGAISGTQQGKIYKINTHTNQISVYIGGALSNADNIAANAALVMDLTRLSINPQNNDIYFMSTCDYLNRGTSGVIIRKVAQNTDGTAGNVTTIAGDCTRAWPANGANALISAIENTPYPSIHGIFYSPGTNAVYYSFIGGGTYKIVNNKIYKISNTMTHTYARLNSASDFYMSSDNGPLLKNIPTSNEAADDVVSTYINHDSAAPDPNCNKDGTLVSAACGRISSLFSLSNGSLGFADGPQRNAYYTLRVRIIDEQNKLRTIAGTSAMSGDGLDKLLTRFSKIRRLQYKSNALPNQALFPEGLYIGDGGANAIGHINLTSGVFSLRGGNMVAKSPASGSVFGPNNYIGDNYTGTAGGIIGFDPLGLLTFYSGNSYIMRVDAAGLIQGVMSGANPYHLAADGAVATDLNTYAYGTWSGLIHDNHGNLYMGPKWAADPAPMIPKFGRIDLANDRFYKVMGGTNNATSADDATPGNAINKDILCTGDIYESCHMGDYDTVNDRLLFAEGNKIRFITTPYNSAISTIGTLLDAGRVIGAFSYIPGQNFVYYMSSNKLYCYDLSAGNPANCNNTQISPPVQLGTFSNEVLTRDSSGNIYVVNSSFNKMILRYVP